MTTTTSSPAPCCPPGSVPAVTATQAGASPAALQGEEILLDNPNSEDEKKMRCYVARPPLGMEVMGVVIMFHDVFGYASARTHHVADLFASHGYFVVSPDWFGKGLGDGLLNLSDACWPPWRIFTGGGSTLYGRLRYPWAKLEQKLTEVVVPYVQRESGNKSMGLLGFCWGGWASMRSCGMPNQPFVCAAIPHGSPGVQKVQHEGPTIDEVVAAVSCPILFAPAGNDPESIRPGGQVIETLNKNPKSQGSESVCYQDMKHGWAVRGDLNDPKVKRDVDDVFRRILDYFAPRLGGMKATF